MTTALLEKKKPRRNEAIHLQHQIHALQEKLETLLHGSIDLQVALPELHDPANGRIDAEKLAAYLGIPLKRLADGLDLSYKAIHRNPSAEAIQPALRPVKRALEILHHFFNKPQTVRVWLNTSHPDLDGRSALEIILANNPQAVLRILENAMAGIPV